MKMAHNHIIPFFLFIDTITTAYVDLRQTDFIVDPSKYSPWFAYGLNIPSNMQRPYVSTVWPYYNDITIQVSGSCAWLSPRHAANPAVDDEATQAAAGLFTLPIVRVLKGASGFSGTTSVSSYSQTNYQGFAIGVSTSLWSAATVNNSLPYTVILPLQSTFLAPGVSNSSGNWAAYAATVMWSWTSLAYTTPVGVAIECDGSTTAFALIDFTSTSPSWYVSPANVWYLNNNNTGYFSNGANGYQTSNPAPSVTGATQRVIIAAMGGPYGTNQCGITSTLPITTKNVTLLGQQVKNGAAMIVIECHGTGCACSSNSSNNSGSSMNSSSSSSSTGVSVSSSSSSSSSTGTRNPSSSTTGGSGSGSGSGNTQSFSSFTGTGTGTDSSSNNTGGSSSSTSGSGSGSSSSTGTNGNGGSTTTCLPSLCVAVGLQDYPLRFANNRPNVAVDATLCWLNLGSSDKQRTQSRVYYNNAVYYNKITNFTGIGVSVIDGGNGYYTLNVSPFHSSVPSLPYYYVCCVVHLYIIGSRK
jgi:hypothetical protein